VDTKKKDAEIFKIAASCTCVAINIPPSNIPKIITKPASGILRNGRVLNKMRDKLMLKRRPSAPSKELAIGET